MVNKLLEPRFRCQVGENPNSFLIGNRFWWFSDPGLHFHSNSDQIFCFANEITRSRAGPSRQGLKEVLPFLSWQFATSGRKARTFSPFFGFLFCRGGGICNFVSSCSSSVLEKWSLHWPNPGVPYMSNEVCVNMLDFISRSQFQNVLSLLFWWEEGIEKKNVHKLKVI